jgi:hypothetical protein
MPDINMQVFEEVQRNQLVTEIDIQTQVVLNDYQVQLSNVDNPTKSQDNVVIDRFGKFLSHWNESLDFNTWVKMSMEIAGKRLLVLGGNSDVSSASSITDTFVDGSEFDDLTGWTQQAGTWTVSGGILTSAATDTAYLRSDIPITESSYIIRFRTQTTNTRETVIAEGNNPLVNNAGTEWMIHDPNNLIYCIDDWTNFPTAATAIVLDTWYLGELKIESGANTASIWDDDGTFKTSVIQTLNSAGTGNYWGILAATDMQSKFDWIFVRKYTSTEPSYNINTPKNIAVALKSLGRAG